MNSRCFPDEEPDQVTILDIINDAIEEFGFESCAPIPLDACEEYAETGVMPSWGWLGGTNSDRVLLGLSSKILESDRYLEAYTYFFSSFSYPINWFIQTNINTKTDNPTII